ncbi:hypothetical protein OG785_34995 [Streptomyces sp. NBC_00006]|uniref:hypothetical protein n=1 Tax=unclassified Streptomyces TaxID=2593676 RepID=UPI0022577F8A|nr:MULTISPECIES: hypothetical protein [unclassified Streptomyces]MCX5535751.1 hypothetical protein [Streptomyces sp. NBC_00006]
MTGTTTLLNSHLQHTPPAVTADELAAARWEDDGGPTALPRRGAQAGHWLRISAALTERLPELADRDDVIVTCEPGTRSGAPAAFMPTLAALEIDAALFAPHPAHTIDPLEPGDEENYPAAWGAFVHEAAHAAHSHWTTPPHLRGTALDAASALLEESRAEAAHLTRRPHDRRWLRAAVHALILDEFTTQAPAAGDVWQAAHAAGLLLARRDAGILDETETDPVAHLLTARLGHDLLATLADIWQAAHTTADDDEQAMLAHGRAWCQALTADPNRPAPTPPTQAAPDTELAEAISQSVDAVHATEHAATRAREQASAAQSARTRARTSQAQHARTSAALAKKIFAPGARPFDPHDPDGPAWSPLRGTRTPTPGEKAAAGRLARGLRAASYRERTQTTVASQAPPGRLNMRQALARDAQRAAGATPTATPFTRTVHHHTPTPPLRVGIAVDVSGSMGEAEGPIASAAWIVARATALSDPDSRAATIAYDCCLTAITAPGRTPAQVPRFHANGFGHNLAEALDALDAALGLSRPGAGRLVVIASDGAYAEDEHTAATARIQALRASGCAALWLAFEPDPTPCPGTTLLQLTDPAQAAAQISAAAQAALATTHT